MKQNNAVFFTSFIVWVDFFNNARVFKYLIKNKIKKQVDEEEIYIFYLKT